MPYRDVAPAYIRKPDFEHVYLSNARGALDQKPPVSFRGASQTEDPNRRWQR
jgi:hypothetical protein